MANFPTYINQNYYLGEVDDAASVKRVEGIPETGEDGVIFYNEFYDTPLYREPNNGAIHKIATSPYRVKNCSYAFNGDTNGLLYWLGTLYGSSAWQNPSDKFYLLSLSSVLYDENYNVTDGSQNQLSDRTNSLATTSDVPNSQVQLFFTTLGGQERVYPTGLYIKSPNSSAYGFIQNWTLECISILDNTIFYTQDFLNDARLVGANSEIYIPINNVGNVPCSFVNIRQTGLNSIGTNHLCLGEIELYGVFK